MQQRPHENAETGEPRNAGEAEAGSVATDEGRREIVIEDGIDDAGDAPEDEGGDEEPTPEGDLAKWKDLALRATADLDNYRKRIAREKSEALRYANQDLLEDLLPVLDNFGMGLQAAAADKDSMIFRGMEMVKKQLDEFLRGQGVEEVPAEGEFFNPNVHEAVSEEESSEVEEGRVLRVVRRGYRMHDRLLRPANVVVAKAPDDESAGEGGDAR